MSFINSRGIGSDDMKIDNEKLNEIRNSLNIVDVISSYIPLSMKGKNYFGVCPFHDDHSPSMSVSKERQIYTCFSCGATGNVFKFIEDYENISFMEAVKKCADMAGISLDISGYKTTNKYQELYDIYELSEKFYQNNINTELGKKAREYLKGRNISEEIIKQPQLCLRCKITARSMVPISYRKSAKNIFKKKNVIQTTQSQYSKSSVNFHCFTQF